MKAKPTDFEPSASDKDDVFDFKLEYLDLQAELTEREKLVTQKYFAQKRELGDVRAQLRHFQCLVNGQGGVQHKERILMVAAQIAGGVFAGVFASDRNYAAANTQELAIHFVASASAIVDAVFGTPKVSV